MRLAWLLGGLEEISETQSTDLLILRVGSCCSCFPYAILATPSQEIFTDLADLTAVALLVLIQELSLPLE